MTSAESRGNAQTQRKVLEMVDHPENAIDDADALANAVAAPQASRFIRELLEKALTNPVRVAPRWEAEAWALLANILMNDYLNDWNEAGPDQLRQAEGAAQNALALKPNLELAHHALGLTYRARGKHQAARKKFATAAAAGSFARAQAQLINQAFLSREIDHRDALDKIEDLIEKNTYHPAIGYFYWIQGRIHLEMEGWEQAKEVLVKSVKALPTVLYNRAALAYALHQHVKYIKRQASQTEEGEEIAKTKADEVANEAKLAHENLMKHPMFGPKLVRLSTSDREVGDNPGVNLRNSLRDWLEERKDALGR